MIIFLLQRNPVTSVINGWMVNVTLIPDPLVSDAKLLGIKIHAIENDVSIFIIHHYVLTTESYGTPFIPTRLMLGSTDRILNQSL